MSFLSAIDLLNQTQHGFREGRFCLSALLEVDDNILAYQLEGSTNVNVIYLDLANKIDRVDRGVLCHKLRHLSILGELDVWFYYFLMICLNLSRYMVLQLFYSTSCKWVLPGYSLGHDIDISGESLISALRMTPVSTEMLVIHQIVIFYIEIWTSI